MMQRNTMPRRPLRRRSWIALGVLAVVLGSVLFVLLRSPEVEGPGSREAPAKSEVKHHRYRNRTLFRPAPADKPEAERPKISGHVYSTAGDPIAGATVVASTFEIAGNLLSTVGTVQSDELGRFELTLPEGTYQLNASVEGYGTTSVSAHSGEVVSLVLPKSGVIEGRVLDERGEPVQRFAIDVLSAVSADVPATPPLFSRTFESPDGSYRIEQLPSWEIVVRATASDHAPAFSPMITVRAEDVEKMDFTLSKGCTLTGRVVDSAGLPQPNVFVDAESVIAAGQMSDVALEAAAQAQTEDDGSFTLPNVPKGAIAVRAYDGSNAVSTVNVEVGECDRVEPVELVMSPGGSIAGVAREADGTPIAGARLTLMHRPIGFVNTVSDAEGRFRFEQVPPGPVRMMMQRADQVTVTGVMVEEDKETHQDMTLPPQGTGELRGRITAGGKPLPATRLMVATHLSEQGSVGLYYPTTAEDGSYRVSGLPPGVYLVNVMSTSTGDGVQVNAGEVATLDLRVIDPPSVKDKAAAMPAAR